MKRVTPLVLAAGLLALAAFAQPARDTQPAAQPGPTFLETVTLLRWGYGALDWLIPHDHGDRNERKPASRN